jgi:hypothetical protein
MSDEQTKAVTAVADATGKLAELAGKVGSFCARLVGQAPEQIGGIATDWATYLRCSNLLMIQDRVDAKLKNRALQGKTIPVPLRLAYPMLQAASLEDDEILQELWANLIANAMDPAHNEKVLPAFVELLKQLSADEGLIIASIPERMKQNNWNWLLFMRDETMDQDGKSQMQKLNEWILFLPVKNGRNVAVYAENLLRLQILTDHRIDCVALTDFGAAFIRECTGETLEGSLPS